ncbi:P-loop containing nucleoside triphosphate hydrolase protein, partial [Mycena galericulata]
SLMGGTGTGKTTFANLVGRSKHLVGDGLESCTQNVQSHEFNFERYRVKLIDVPGFDDTSKSDADILKMIADFLLAEYKAGRSLSGIIYVHRISDVRMGGASRRNFTMFKKLCGEDAFANVAIVTTRWDLEETAVAEARLAQLQASSQLFKSVLDGGASIHRHNRGYESACDILRHLVGKVPKPLLIQSEMAGGKEVSETAAGQELQREILEQVEKHEREMSELLEEMAQSRD